MSRAVRLCPSLVIVRPDFTKYKAVSRAGVRALPRGDAAGRAAVARRGLSRRHRERLGRAARHDAWRGGSRTRSATRTGLTASAGVAPNKFLAKIASGWQKPDGLTVIAPERVEHVSPGAAGGRAVGRRPGHGAKAAGARHREAGGRPHRRPGSCCATRWARWPTGCSSWRAASTTGPSSRSTSRSRRAARTRSPRPDRHRRRSARRSTSMARDAAAWLSGTTLRAHGHDQGALQRLHHDHAQPHRAGRRATVENIARRGRRAARQDRGRPHARCGCSASASTTCARRSHAAEPAGSAAAVRRSSRQSSRADGRRGVRADGAR